MNDLTTIESKRRGVAPIIATLLMVAIAVVGGILIFVFTQGFFGDSQVVGPTVDNIRIIGYSANDSVVDVIDEAESADGTLSCDANVVNSRLLNGECITIFIENLGDKPVAFQAVRIFGETHTPQTGASADTCPTTAGQFAIFDTTTPGATLAIVDPNTVATVCIAYDGNTVKAGRTIPIQVETSNGQSSQINIINGATRGQQ